MAAWQEWAFGWDGAEPTTYPVTITGSIGLAGAVQKKPNKLFTGAVSSTGVAVRRSARFFAGSMAPTGVATKRPSKSFTGALTPTGAATKRISRQLSGVLSLIGQPTKRLFKMVSGDLTAEGEASPIYLPFIGLGTGLADATQSWRFFFDGVGHGSSSVADALIAAGVPGPWTVYQHVTSLGLNVMVVTGEPAALHAVADHYGQPGYHTTIVALTGS